MKAVYISDFGGPEVLEIRDVPDPREPNEGEVLVRVLNAGLNRADLLQRRGLYPPPDGYDPRIPGLEFAGRVYKVGAGVEGFKENDRVFGIAAGEAQAEYILTDQRLVAHIPDIDTWDAAAVPEAYVTAHDALITQAGVGKKEVVLIHAIASGVGIAAAQIAKAAGAVVVGTSRSSEKLLRFGKLSFQGKPLADHLIETADGPLFADNIREFTDRRGADVVLDLVGGDYFPENLRCMAEKGRIVLVGLTAGRKAEFDMGIALAKRFTIKGTVLRSRSIEEKAEAMNNFKRDIVPHIGPNGTFFPEVDRYFPLEEISEAHRYLESNQSFGKVVLNLA
ncbi:MAG: NAD(P)H-quinone oxidoreductase [Acidobacteria bacterium]|nr:NAD(P)H-quinone oxidoreductase [Acidobacteriota bacterium]